MHLAVQVRIQIGESAATCFSGRPRSRSSAMLTGGASTTRRIGQRESTALYRASCSWRTTSSTMGVNPASIRESARSAALRAPSSNCSIRLGQRLLARIQASGHYHLPHPVHFDVRGPRELPRDFPRNRALPSAGDAGDKPDAVTGVSKARSVDGDWWAYFDDRQNHLRDVAGDAVSPPRPSAWALWCGGAEERQRCLGSPVRIVRSPLMESVARRECAHSNVQGTCYVSVLGTSRVLISSMAS